MLVERARRRFRFTVGFGKTTPAPHPDRSTAHACRHCRASGERHRKCAHALGRIADRCVASHVDKVRRLWRFSGAVQESRLANSRVERVMGIEPTLAAWEAAVLPLNYTRVRTSLFGPNAGGNVARGCNAALRRSDAGGGFGAVVGKARLVLGPCLLPEPG